LKDITAEFCALDLERFAFFFDFDGTLAEIAPRPQDVVLSPGLRRDLGQLYLRTRGAVAIITGRQSSELVSLVGPDLPVAGLHGMDFPDAAPTPDRIVAARVAAIRSLLPDLARLIADHPGALLEDKRQGFALHWRGASEAEAALTHAAQEALARLGDGWSLQPGKSVIEIRPAGDDKGTALRRFLTLPAFRGRRPIAFGDDLNDLPMLASAQAAGGIAVAMGEVPLAADLRLAGPEALAAWLNERLAA